MSRIESISTINVGKIVGLNVYSMKEKESHLIKWVSGTGKGTLTDQAFVLALSPRLKYKVSNNNPLYSHYNTMYNTNTNNSEKNSEKEKNEELARVFQLREKGNIKLYKSCVIVEYINDRTVNKLISITYLDKSIANPQKNPVDLVKRTFIELKENNLSDFYSKLTTYLKYDDNTNMHVFEAINRISDSIEYVSIKSQTSSEIISYTENSSLYTKQKDNVFFLFTRKEINRKIEMGIQSSKDKIPEFLISKVINRLKFRETLEQSKIDDMYSILNQAKKILDSNPKFLQDQCETIEKYIPVTFKEKSIGIENKLLSIIEQAIENNETNHAQIIGYESKLNREKEKLKSDEELLNNEIEQKNKNKASQEQNLENLREHLNVLKLNFKDTDIPSYTIDKLKEYFEGTLNDDIQKLIIIKKELEGNEENRLIDKKNKEIIINNLNKEISRIKTTIENIEKTISENEIIIEKVKKEKEESPFLISELNKKIEEKNVLINDIKNENENNKKKLVFVSREYTDIEENIINFENKKQEIQIEINNISSLLTSKEQKIKGLEIKKDKLNDILNSKETYLNTTNQELQNIRYLVENKNISFLHTIEVNSILTKTIQSLIILWKQYNIDSYNKAMEGFDESSIKKELTHDEIRIEIKNIQTEIEELIEQKKIDINKDKDKRIIFFFMNEENYIQKENDKLIEKEIEKKLIEKEIEKNIINRDKLEKELDEFNITLKKYKERTPESLEKELDELKKEMELDLETITNDKNEVKIKKDKKQKLEKELEELRDFNEEDSLIKLKNTENNLKKLKEKSENISEIKSLFKNIKKNLLKIYEKKEDSLRENNIIINNEIENSIARNIKELNTNENTYYDVQEILENWFSNLKKLIEEKRTKLKKVKTEIEDNNDSLRNLEKEKQNYDNYDKKIDEYKSSKIYKDSYNFLLNLDKDTYSSYSIKKLFEEYEKTTKQYYEIKKSLEIVEREFLEQQWKSPIHEDSQNIIIFDQVKYVLNEYEKLKDRFSTEIDSQKLIIEKINVLFIDITEMHDKLFNNFARDIRNQQKKVKEGTITKTGSHLEFFIENIENIKKGIFNFKDKNEKYVSDNFFEEISIFFNSISSQSKNIFDFSNASNNENIQNDITTNFENNNIDRKAFDSIIKIFEDFSIEKYKRKISELILNGSKIRTINDLGEDIGSSTGMGLALLTKLSLNFIIEKDDKEELVNFPFIVDEISGANSEDILEVKNMLLKKKLTPVFTQNEARLNNEFLKDVFVHDIQKAPREKEKQLFVSYTTLNEENISNTSNIKSIIENQDDTDNTQKVKRINKIDIEENEILNNEIEVV